MLRVFCTNVMGRLHVSVNCYAHGVVHGHTLWSGSVAMGAEGPAEELAGLGEGIQLALRSWHQGEWDFTDDCFDMLPGGVRVPWGVSEYG